MHQRVSMFQWNDFFGCSFCANCSSVWIVYFCWGFSFVAIQPNSKWFSNEFTSNKIVFSLRLFLFRMCFFFILFPIDVLATAVLLFAHGDCNPGSTFIVTISLRTQMILAIYRCELIFYVMNNDGRMHSTTDRLVRFLVTNSIHDIGCFYQHHYLLPTTHIRNLK